MTKEERYRRKNNRRRLRYENDPEYRAKVKARNSAYRLSDEGRQRHRERMSERSQTPEWREYKKQRYESVLKPNRRDQWNNIDPQKKAERLAKMKEYRERPEVQERIRRRRQTPEYKKRIRQRNQQLREDPGFKLSNTISSAMRKALGKKKAGRHWEDFVDYTLDELMRHLEALLEPGMTWDNRGRNGWHIDHDVPKSWLPYETPEDGNFQLCWSLYNLQPMWEAENIRKLNRRKGDRFPR